jgi:hypothetical protein
MRFDEVEEDAGRWRERTTPMVNEVELPGEAKPTDRNHPQLFGVELSFDAKPGNECDSEAAFRGILDARIVAELRVVRGTAPTAGSPAFYIPHVRSRS